MNQSEPNTPDEFWKKAFEEATETPPPRVWNAIERRLDESRGPKILPLWGTGLASSQPVVWGIGVAATVALVLVGSWLMRSPTSNPSMAHTKPSLVSEPVATIPDRPVNIPANTVSKEATGAVAIQRKLSASPVLSLGNQTEHPPAALISQSTGESLAQTGLSPRVEDNATGLQPAVPTLSMPDRFMPLVARKAMISTASNFRSESQNGSESNSGLAVGLEPLTARPVRLREPAPIGRIVWFNPVDLTESTDRSEAAQTKRHLKEVWASVSLMPGAFNPAVTVQSRQPGVAYASTLSTSTVNPPSLNSRARFSVAYLADAGIQLTEHWSLESGVGYLLARSTVESPTSLAVASIQTTNVNPGAIEANLYVDALRNSSRNQTASNGLMVSAQDKATNSNYVVATNYDNQTRRVLTNNYQYVQVPIQVGYQLRPRKRLSLALLGGFLTNIFVRNTVNDELVISTKDGIYRPLSWAANVGARFRYRPSRRWSASLAGVYQPSLGPGTQPDSQVQSSPTATGLRFGVDYHF